MKNNNQIKVPQAREAMDLFKMLICSEGGVNLRGSYNASLTSREVGRFGPYGKEHVSRTNRKIRQNQSDFHRLCHSYSVHISCCFIASTLMLVYL